WVSSTWRNAPFDYATHGAGLDCATCHAGPGTGAWGGTQNWVGGNFAHSTSSLAASPCVACHTTQRPNPALLTSANAALPVGVQFDHSTATGDCATCHVSASFSAWTGGKRPPAGSATPSTCLPCHQGERPTSTAGWVSTTWRNAPVDHATHGAGLACAPC